MGNAVLTALKCTTSLSHKTF